MSFGWYAIECDANKILTALFIQYRFKTLKFKHQKVDFLIYYFLQFLFLKGN